MCGSPPALAIEYLLAYDIALDQATQVTISEKDKRMLPIDGSYGLRLQFGGRYYPSPKLYFFGTLVAEYYKLWSFKRHFRGQFREDTRKARRQAQRRSCAIVSALQSRLCRHSIRYRILGVNDEIYTTRHTTCDFARQATRKG